MRSVLKTGFCPAGICFDPFTATLLIVGAGLQIGSAVSQYKQSKKQAQAIADQGKVEAEAKARQVKRAAAGQKVAFLNSGISLTGEDDLVGQTLTDTYTYGKQDVQQIVDNANQKSKNIVGQARAQLIGSIGKTALGVAGSGVLSGFGAAGGGLGGQASAFSGGNSLALSSTQNAAMATPNITGANSFSRVLFTP